MKVTPCILSTVPSNQLNHNPYDSLQINPLMTKSEHSHCLQSIVYHVDLGNVVLVICAVAENLFLQFAMKLDFFYFLVTAARYDL